MRRFGVRAMSLCAATLLLLATNGCGDDAPANSATSPALNTSPAGAVMNLTLTSSAFANNATIPVQYTCDGAGRSPGLTWQGELDAAKSFALVVHDPDAPRAGGYTHWVLYGLPAGATSLPEGASPGGQLPAGAEEGKNSDGKDGYTPPCPPRGNAPHHYNFTLYALDAPLNLDPGKSQDDLEKAMRGHILAQATYTGLYARR